MSRILNALKGHNLAADAAPFTAEGEPINRGKGTAGVGRAKCECGWLSNELPTGNARRLAHRAHKEDIVKMTELRAKHGLTEPEDEVQAEHASVEAIEAALAAGEAEDLIGSEEPAEAPEPTPAPAPAPAAAESEEGLEPASSLTVGDVVDGYVVAAVRVGSKRVTGLTEDLEVVVYARPDELIKIDRAEDGEWPAPGTEVKTIKGSVLHVGDYVRKGGQPIRVAALWTDGRLVKAQGPALEMLFNGPATGTVEVFN